MAIGNTYAAPQLPLTGAEQFTGFQQQNGQVVTCTFTFYQLQQAANTLAFASPPPIGSTTPNTGAFTTLSFSEFLSGSVAEGLTATGNTQNTAYAIAAQYAVFTTVAATTGAVLPIEPLATTFTVLNRGANPLTLYPPLNGQIEALSVNEGTTIYPGGSVRITQTSADLWRIE